MKENIEAYFQVGTILWMSYPPAMYSKSGEGYEAVSYTHLTLPTT